MRIETRDLCFGYGSGPNVLNRIDLVLDGPGLYCIVGPNGVGKSTLVKCLNKILKPTSGTVQINGIDIDQYGIKDLAKFMSYVPNNSSDLFSMPVSDVVMMGCSGTRGWRVSDEDINRTYSTLKLLGIEDLADKGFSELSAGQHQKVTIARGLVGKPEIIILDEPTSNLDVKHQVEMMEILKDVADCCGSMIIMISHDLNVSAKYADEIIAMRQPGILYDVGRPEEIVTERMIEDVYGMRSEIIHRSGRPHVILGEPIYT